MNTSFEERSVWIQLVSVVLVLGAYFVVAGLMLSNGVLALPAYVPVFAVAIVLMVAVLAVGHIVAVMFGRPEGRDERDRLIEWRAEGNSSWILSSGALAAIIGLILSVEHVWIADLLLLSLCASQVARFVFQLVYHRSGV